MKIMIALIKTMIRKKMMVGIKGIINDRYIKVTSRKIKAVKEQKYEKGYYMGFIVLYGYKKSKGRRWKNNIKNR